MVKRAFLLLLVLSAALALDAFTYYEYSGNSGTAKILFYEGNATSETPFKEVPLPSVEELNLKVVSTDLSDSAQLSCSPLPVREKGPIEGLILNGYSCDFQTPSFAEGSCARFSFEFIGQHNGERVKITTPPSRACDTTLTSSDAFINMIRATGLLDLSNPICFSTLLVLALFMAAYHARSGGTVVSLYDFIYPKIFKPKELKYSLRGPSPVGKVAQEAKLIHEVSARRLRAALGLSAAASAAEIKRAFARRARQRFGDAPEDFNRLMEFLDKQYRKPDVEKDSLYELFRLMGQYINTATGSALIPKLKTSKIGETVESHPLFAPVKYLTDSKRPRAVRAVGKVLGFSVMPLSLAKKGLVYGLKNIRTLARATLGMTGFTAAMSGTYAGIKARAKKEGKLPAFETFEGEISEAKGWKKFLGAPVATTMALERKYSFFNFRKNQEQALQMLEENLRRTLFWDILAHLMSQKGTNISDILEKLRNAALSGASSEELSALRADLLAKLGDKSSLSKEELALLSRAWELLESLDLNDANSVWRLSDFLMNDVEMDAYASEVSRFASIAEENAHSDSARLFALLQYGASEFSDFLRESGSIRPFLEDHELKEGDLLGLRFLDNTFNFIRSVEGGLSPEGDELFRSLQNGLDYTLMTDRAAKYGVGNPDDVAAYYEAMMDNLPEHLRNAKGSLVNDAREAADLVNAILTEMFQRTSSEGFTVDEGKLLLFVKEQEGKRHYSPFDFLNDKRTAKKMVETHLQVEMGARGRPSEEIEAATRRATRLLDFIGVAKETKVKEPFREGYRGFRWNVITSEDVSAARKKGVSHILEKQFYENVSALTALHDASKGLVNDPVGLLVRARAGSIAENADSLASSLSSSLNIDKNALARKIERFLTNMFSEGTPENKKMLTSKDPIKFIEAQMRAFLRKELSKQGLKRKEIKKALPELEGWARKVWGENTTLVDASIQAIHGVAMESFYTIDSDRTQGVGLRQIHFINGTYVHALLFAEAALSKSREYQEATPEEKSMMLFNYVENLPVQELTDKDIERLKKEGVYFLKTAEGLFIPLFSDTPVLNGVSDISHRNRAVDLFAGLKTGRHTAQVMESISNHIREYSLNALLGRIRPSDSLVGLEKVNLIYIQGGIVKRKSFIELREATYSEMREVLDLHASRMTREEEASFRTVLSLISTHGDNPEVLLQNKEHFQRVIDVISRLSSETSTNNLSVEPELAARIAKSYMNVTRDPSLLYNLPEVVYGTREVLKRVWNYHYNNLKELSEDSSRGMLETVLMKAAFLKETAYQGLKSAESFLVDSISRTAYYYMPLEGAEAVALQNEVSKYAMLDALEYAEKRRSEALSAESDLENVELLLSRLLSRKSLLLVQNPASPELETINRQLSQLQAKRERLKGIIENKAEILRETNEVIDAVNTYITRYGYYFGKSKYFLYGSLMGSKEVALAMQKHARGGYLKGSILSGILSIHEDMLKELPLGGVLRGFYASGISAAISVAEFFRKPATVASIASGRALGLPAGADVAREVLDERLRKALEEKYGKLAGISPGVYRAKDSAIHWTKTRADVRSALAFREMLAHTLGFGIPVGAAMLSVAALGGVGIAAAGAVGLALSSKKVRERVAGMYNTMMRKINDEELRSVMDLDEMEWRINVGMQRYSWLSRETGYAMGGPSQNAITGLAYAYATTGEYAVSPAAINAYNVISQRVRRLYGGEAAPEFHYMPTTPFGGSRFTLSLANKLEDQFKELEGYGPNYNFAFGLLSPAFLMDYIGAQLSYGFIESAYRVRNEFAMRVRERETKEALQASDILNETEEQRQERLRRQMEEAKKMYVDVLKKGTVSVAKTSAVGSVALGASVGFMPLPALMSVGSAIISRQTAAKGYVVQCPRCKNLKERTRVCPHCGFVPAYSKL